MAEYDKWMDNVGEVFLSDTECFWMFPRHMFLNKRLCITNPWFSHESETWRLVKTPKEGDNNYVCVYLWKKIQRRPSKYTFRLYIKTFYSDIIANYTGVINSDFGDVCYDFFNIQDKEKCNSVSICGLVKLFFEIQKEEYIDVLARTDTVVENDDRGKIEPVKIEGPETKGVHRLAKNLKSLMVDEQSSDVVLKVEDREFKVHKNILKVRSPVFASMFQPHTKESATGVVDIPDCSESAFEAFLLYIYTGNSGVISSDKVCDLYYAADKYEVNDLKSECVEFMENNLSVENFCEIMTLCFLHSESCLHKTATLFFCENVKTIIKTVQWQKVLKDFSTQVNELYIKAINA